MASEGDSHIFSIIFYFYGYLRKSTGTTPGCYLRPADELSKDGRRRIYSFKEEEEEEEEDAFNTILNRNMQINTLNNTIFDPHCGLWVNILLRSIQLRCARKW